MQAVLNRAEQDERSMSTHPDLPAAHAGYVGQEAVRRSRATGG